MNPNDKKPPRDYPENQTPVLRSDGSVSSFVDDTTGVHDLPKDVRDPMAHAIDSALRGYHSRVEPSRAELTAIYQLQARMDALLETFLSPAVKALLARAASLESGREKSEGKMEAFFNAMGVKTRLSGYNLGAADIDAVLAVLEKHRMVKLGEHRDVTLEVSRKVLEMSL